MYYIQIKFGPLGPNCFSVPDVFALIVVNLFPKGERDFFLSAVYSYQLPRGCDIHGNDCFLVARLDDGHASISDASVSCSFAVDVAVLFLDNLPQTDFIDNPVHTVSALNPTMISHVFRHGLLPSFPLMV